MTLFEYTTMGPDGACGHRHRTERTAEKCLDKYRRDARAVGIRPVRRVVLFPPGDDLPYFDLGPDGR